MHHEHIGIPLCDYFADMMNNGAKLLEAEEHRREGRDSANAYHSQEEAAREKRIKRTMFMRIIPELITLVNDLSNKLTN